MKTFLVSALFSAALLPSLATAGTVVADGQWGQVVIETREREMIQRHYRQFPPSPCQAASGKKQKKLPPGLQKKLARGGSLPPGWQKKAVKGEVLGAPAWACHQPLPSVVLERLPPAPDGVITVRVEGRIVRLIEASRVILDAFDL